MKKEHILLAIILILGLFLRIYNLGNESLWLDEGFSVRISQQNISQIIDETSLHAHPPLYYFILHYWIILFGDSEFSTRFLSVVFGLLTIIMIYVIGNLMFNKEVGILGALLLGASTFHIQYAQEVRNYTLLSFLTLTSMYFFIRFFEKKTLKNYAGYILSSSLLIYTHIFGFFIILSQNIYIVGFQKNKLKEWILIQLALMILFIPWTRILINNILLELSGTWLPKPSIYSLIDLFLIYSGQYSLFGIEILLVIFTLLTFYSLIDKSANTIDFTNNNIILILWLLVSILFPLIISIFFTPIINPEFTTKYSIGASLAFYLFVAKGIQNINHRYIKLGIIISILLFSLLSIQMYNSTIHKENWRDLGNYVNINAKSSDLLIFNDGFIKNNVFDYYSKRSDLKNEMSFPAYLSNISYVINDEDINELKSTLKDYDRVWLIKRSSGSDRNELIKKELCETYYLSYYKNYNGIYMYIFDKNETNGVYLCNYKNWYDNEFWQGISNNWISNNASILRYSSEKNKSNLSFKISSFYRPRILQIYLNDELISRQNIELNLIDIKVLIKLKKGNNIIEFYTSDGCDRPIDIIGSKSKDTRCLSFVFQNITLT